MSKIYNFHPETNALLGCTFADASPLEPGVFLIPAHATIVEPPSFNAATERCIFNGSEWAVSTTPEPPMPTPEQIKTRVWESIKSVRDSRRFGGGVLVGGKWFKSDERATTEYLALVALGAGLPGGTVLRAGWRTMEDGVTIDMTATLAKQILAAGLASVAAIDDVAQAHKAALFASADPANYDYTTGWPAVFGE